MGGAAEVATAYRWRRPRHGGGGRGRLMDGDDDDEDRLGSSNGDDAEGRWGLE